MWIYHTDQAGLGMMPSSRRRECFTSLSSDLAAADCKWSGTDRCRTKCTSKNQVSFHLFQTALISKSFAAELHKRLDWIFCFPSGGETFSAIEHQHGIIIIMMSFLLKHPNGYYKTFPLGKKAIYFFFYSSNFEGTQNNSVPYLSPQFLCHP